MIIPKRLLEIDIADRAFATRRRRVGFEISMLPVSIPAILKVLLVATRVTSLSQISGATQAMM